jgi:hypothetical protein
VKIFFNILKNIVKFSNLKKSNNNNEF